MGYGAPWLETTLVTTAAWAGVHPKGSHLHVQLLDLTDRGSARKTILAGAASMPRACNEVLRDGVPCRALGPDHFAPRDEAKTIRRPVRRLRDPGCEVDARHAAQSLLIGNL